MFAETAEIAIQFFDPFLVRLYAFSLESIFELLQKED
jgi:hypothetical protein